MRVMSTLSYTRFLDFISISEDNSIIFKLLLLSIVLLLVLATTNGTICNGMYSSGDWFVYRVLHRVGSYECVLYQRVELVSVSSKHVSYGVSYMKICGDFWACTDLLPLANKTLYISEDIDRGPESMALFIDPQYSGIYISNNTILQYYRGVLIYAANFTQLQQGECCRIAITYTIELVNSSRKDLFTAALQSSGISSVTTEREQKEKEKIILLVITSAIASFALGFLAGRYLSEMKLRRS